MIIEGFDDGDHSIRHVHQFSRQHAMPSVLMKKAPTMST
jgi:hypothetical protein